MNDYSINLLVPFTRAQLAQALAALMDAVNGRPVRLRTLEQFDMERGMLFTIFASVDPPDRPVRRFMWNYTDVVGDRITLSGPVRLN